MLYQDINNHCMVPLMLKENSDYHLKFKTKVFTKDEYSDHFAIEKPLLIATKLAFFQRKKMLLGKLLIFLVY